MMWRSPLTLPLADAVPAYWRTMCKTMAMTLILQYALPVAVAMGILKTCALFPCRQAEEAVLLGDLADVEEGVGPITIRRVNKERIINIQCNLTDRPLNEVVKELTQKLNTAGLKEYLCFLRSGDHDERFLCRNGYGIVTVIYF